MLTRSIEHQKDSMRGKWESAWSTEHSKDTSRDTAPKTLAKLSNIHERKIRKSLEIIQRQKQNTTNPSLLNGDRGNIVNRDAWKPLFRKVNMVRDANAMEQILLRVRFNYIIYICICVEPQRNQLVGYCSSRKFGSYVILHRTQK